MEAQVTWNLMSMFPASLGVYVYDSLLNDEGAPPPLAKPQSWSNPQGVKVSEKSAPG